ncbi:hypothetical protein [Acuticoccus sediminis]|uniref:hypothetical protein n=1 Tax=Acuticoccus sediminis TaxID=2184697 RepID=UPI001CFE2D1B|nr:hypothetical protein [Acuticoccus sediminis]
MTEARTLMADEGRTFCEELSIPLARGTPSPLFRWLTACILSASPIRHDQAARAARALADAGLTTARKMADATWETRRKILNENGYARFDERTASILGDAAQLIVDEYGGDLRRLREAAGHDPKDERARLKSVKGVGDTAVDIFFREVQAIWDELYPFADDLALEAAKRHRMGRDAKALAETVPRKSFPHLVVALARDELSHRHR